jgi:hypothetical protein
VSLAEPKSKGINLATVQTFVCERHGEESWSRVLARLSREDRETMLGFVMVGWYPTGLMLRLADAAAAELDGPGNDLRQAMGRHGAEHQLGVIHRLFLRAAASPGYVLEKAGNLWDRFHDTGTWVVEREGTWARGTLRGFVIDAGYCRGLTAYIGRMFELVGAREVHVEHSLCRAREDDVCVWEGHWT